MLETDLTAGQAAKRVGLSREAIDDMIREGILPAYYLGTDKRAYRIRAKDIDTVVEWLRDRISDGEPKRWVRRQPFIGRALKELGASEELIASVGGITRSTVEAWDDLVVRPGGHAT